MFERLLLIIPTLFDNVELVRQVIAILMDRFRKTRHLHFIFALEILDIWEVRGNPRQRNHVHISSLFRPPPAFSQTSAIPSFSLTPLLAP